MDDSRRHLFSALVCSHTVPPSFYASTLYLVHWLVQVTRTRVWVCCSIGWFPTKQYLERSIGRSQVPGIAFDCSTSIYIFGTRIAAAPAAAQQARSKDCFSAYTASTMFHSCVCSSCAVCRASTAPAVVMPRTAVLLAVLVNRKALAPQRKNAMEAAARSVGSVPGIIITSVT